MKEASDKLPPSRPYDHKIILKNGEGVKNLGYSPLYYQSVIELETVKHYLMENLYKGFIETSQASFTLSILFIKKSNKGLRFYIDYQKLNNLIKKDRYLLSLIDEIFIRLI